MNQMLRKTEDLKLHKEHALVPDMRPREYADLLADIRTFGIKVPLDTVDAVVIDGKHRLRAAKELRLPEVPVREVQLNGESSAQYMLKMAVLRRHLSDDQRAVMAAIYACKNPKPRGRPKAGQENAEPRGSAFTDRHPGRDEAMALLNVPLKQVMKASELLRRAPELAEKVRTGEMALGKARKHCQAEQQRQALTTAAASLPPADERFQLHVGDFCDICDTLPNGSIDAIITDPPYPKEFLPVYGRLAEVAARLLKPGGSLVVMVGQSYLPEIVAAMAQHLAYRWMLAYLTPGGQAPQIWDRKVNTFWKPVLWFTAGTYQGDWIGDVVNTAANDNDKRFHHWGQGEGGMCRLVERFTKPSDTVLDPFLGGGTTGVVTVRLQRRFIGIDCDEKALDTARARIALAAREAAV